MKITVSQCPTRSSSASRRVNVVGGYAASLLLASCTTLQPYSLEEQAYLAQDPATNDALSQPVAGLMTPVDAIDRKRRELVRSGLGSLAGRAVEQYQDRQEARLREALEGTGVSVTRIEQNISLSMPASVVFAATSADLTAGFFATLDLIGEVLKEFDNTVIEIAGHTDNMDTPSYNETLSMRQAQSISGYLVARDVLVERIVEVGAGSSKLLIDSQIADRRQINRRVEITLVPVTAG